MSDSYGETMVARALVDAVNRAGPMVASEPRRVHGMISDSLGSDGRTRRPEIDAVVLAAKERIPDDLIANRVEPGQAVEALQRLGLDLETARFSVDVWRYALGLLGADAEAPTLTRSIESSTNDGDGVVGIGVIGHVDVLTPESSSQSSDFDDATLFPDHDVTPRRELSDELLEDDLESEADQPVRAEEAVPPPDNEDSITDRRRDREHVRLAPVAAGIAVLLLVSVAVVALLLSGGGDDEIALKTVKGDQKGDQATTRFEPVKTTLGVVERSWTVDKGKLSATLEFNNDTDAPVTGVHYEVIPKAMAKSASQIRSEPPFEVVKEDPIISWKLTVPARKTAKVTYSLAVPKNTSDQVLEEWKKAQLSDTREFDKERAKLPTLTIATPRAQTIAVGEFDLAGSADPTAKVTVAGVPVPVASDGKWMRHIGALTAGPHAIEVIATSRFGAVSKTSFTITFTPPAVDPAVETRVTAPPRTERPSSSTVPTTSPRVTAPTPTTTPRTPVTSPPPPPISISIYGPSSVWSLGSYCYYTNFIRPVGFTPTAVKWSAPAKVDRYEGYEYAFSPNQETPPGNYKITVTATAPDGRKVSASKAIRLEYNTDASCIE